FERHFFHRLTNGRFDASDPDISSSRAGGYLGGAREYDRLERAVALARAEGLQSASWGAFQIMGANYEAAGFQDVEAFCVAMQQSEDKHLEAFVNFVKANHLDDELRRRDWKGFARGYNGPGYLQNRYDTKLAAAFTLHSNGGARAGAGAMTRTL